MTRESWVRSGEVGARCRADPRGRERYEAAMAAWIRRGLGPHFPSTDAEMAAQAALPGGDRRRRSSTDFLPASAAGIFAQPGSRLANR